MLARADRSTRTDEIIGPTDALKPLKERRRLLGRERDEVERRLARWYERIESDDALEDAAADRTLFHARISRRLSSLSSGFDGADGGIPFGDTVMTR